MINKLFFGYSALRLNYTRLDDTQAKPIVIPLPEEISLLAGCTAVQAERVAKKKTLIKKGAQVKTGERLRLFEADDLFILSTVTGTVTGVTLYTGPLGRKLIRITLAPEDRDIMDETFFDTKKLDRDSFHKFISQLPGRLQLLPMKGALPDIRELVICCGEKDISVIANQYAMACDRERIRAGIGLLKETCGTNRVTIAVPETLSAYEGTGAKAVTISRRYPSASPRLIAEKILERPVPAAKSITQEGLGFVSAETAAAVGRIVRKEPGVFDKTLSLIMKNGTSILVKVRIGTPISHVLSLFKETLEEGDYLIAGGPLTGVAIHDPAHTVSPYFDAILVCAGEDILENSDYGCINCGKCVRVCPARVPVNMLVRHLARRDYNQARDHFSLDACLECGLCTYICVSKIPILQRIKLGKMKLRAMKQDPIDGGNDQ